LAGAAVPVSFGVEPLHRAGEARLLPSLAAYSFRNYMKDTNHKPDAEANGGRKIDLFEFIDYCAEQGCAGTELTSYYFPNPVTADFLIALKRHAFLKGIAISGTAVGNTFTLEPGPKRDAEIAGVKQWIDHAALMGAPHIRVFAGNLVESKETSIKRSIEALEETGEHAARKGVFLGIENHGGIVAEADALLEIVRAVKNPWIGINLDTGNFHTADPYADLERCAPYAVNVQVKADIQRKGRAAELADLEKVIGILRKAKYQGFVALEYESKEDPWRAVPPLLKKLRELCHG
jgi:sugar phosphate isomerase/epimerase